MPSNTSPAACRATLTGPGTQILTGASDFVPTGWRGENGEPWDWQTAMKRAVRSAAQLRQILALPSGDDGEQGQPFPTFVPWEFIARMQPGNPADPLLLQVLPTASEAVVADGFSADPVGDQQALATGGLLHKYAGRTLLIASGVCGVHCRYCFRREFPYSDNNPRNAEWQPALEYLRARPEIDEVILSGGDPLTMVDSVLDRLLHEMEQIEHVRRLRIHSRMPIVIPQRVTTALVERFAASRLAVWMVIHCNHPQELDSAVARSLAMLVDGGIPVLNQAVLLRGVNDHAETLIELCRRLVDQRVVPYYLHQLDRVQGAVHFEVPVETGKKLVRQLRSALPGYAVPQYVCERAGQPSKSPLSECVW